MARRNSLMVSRVLYQIGIVTILATLIWASMGIYYALNNSTNNGDEVDKKILEPINPVIDQEVIKALSDRLVVDVVQNVESSVSATPVLNDSIDQGSQP